MFNEFGRISGQCYIQLIFNNFQSAFIAINFELFVSFRKILIIIIIQIIYQIANILQVRV